MVDKDTLRRVYLEKRLFLSKKEHNRRNRLLQVQLAKVIDFSSYSCLHIFLSMANKKEVNTFKIIEQARKGHAAIDVVTSKTRPKGELQHYLLREDTVIRPNNWGTPEPQEADLAPIDKIDLVLVPLLAFDKVGHRIGYGKGYYDRFLKKVPHAKKIGLSLASPLDTIPYINETDVKMDGCITPFKVYDFK